MASKQLLTSCGRLTLAKSAFKPHTSLTLQSIRCAATDADSKQTEQQQANKTEKAPDAQAKKHHKTMKELDEELKLKMEGISGDGGASGVEYEDGVPVAMKRSVKNNMFRYI